MTKNILPAITALLIVILLIGIIYPWAVDTYGQLFSDHRLDGSLMVEKGKIRSEERTGQAYNDPKYFWGLSLISAPSYNSAPSNGSNSSSAHTGSTISGAFHSETPTPSQTSADRVNPDMTPKSEPTWIKPAPIVPVPTPGNNLNFGISPAAAQLQINRIARLRGMEPGVLQSMIDQYTEKQEEGALGEPRVNVLKLNQALDRFVESRLNAARNPFQQKKP